MTNAIVTISPINNEVKVKVAFGKEEKKGVIIHTVAVNLGLGIKFAALTEEEKTAILDKCKEVKKSMDTLVLDLNTLNSVNAGFVPVRETGYRSRAEKRADWILSKVSEEKSFDNMHNEGGEGFNPYRCG